ncbi:MAG: AMP-binding protein [Bacteriovoracaceae bacterium]|nr:AMP-binding protein [Bacteriovoracaceae bacterium]
MTNFDSTENPQTQTSRPSKPWIKNYDQGVAATIDLNEYENIGEIFEKSFTKFAQYPAFTNFGKTLSYSELDVLTKKVASMIQNEWGLTKGDRVAIMMPNVLQYPIVLFALLRAGYVVVNVNPLYTARELEHQLIDSGAKAIFIYANSAHILEKVINNTTIKHVVVTGIGDQLGFPKSLLINFALKYVKKMVPDYRIFGSITWTELLMEADENKFTPVKSSHGDTAFLQYTGGTTGVAKGAILTHRNIIANVLQAKAWLGNFITEGKEIIITPLPLYHIFSLTANCLIFSSIGAQNILITNPRDMKGFVNELKKWKFTAFTGVNTLFNGLVHNKAFAKLDFSSLRMTLGGGMAVQRAVAEEWKKITGKPLVEAYGLTETSPAACINPMSMKEFNGFIGLPIPSTDVSIKDEQGKDLPFGEVGEICIRGPQVMQGYWNKPEETALVMTIDGYFRSGDLGIMTPEGFCRIVDRKKDMILVSGFNVYPNELEDVLAKHPKILEVAAVGVSDPRSGEVVKLFIVKKDKTLNENEVLAFCKENFTGYKIPKFIEFRAELPKTNVGKILRRELRG